MSRQYLDSVLTKTLHISGYLIALLIAVEKLFSPSEDLVHVIRFVLLTGFIFSSFALPLVRPSSSWLKALGLIGMFLYIIGIIFPTMSILLGIAIIIGVIMVFINLLFNGTKEESNDHEHYQMPGPSKRSGMITTSIKYYTSMILSLFNPFQFVQMIKQIISQKNTSELIDFQQKGKYTLPFTDEWFIANGGIDKKDSHSWEIVNQRYAYDFIIANSNGCSHANDGDTLKDYYCYGQNILSPGDGEVIEVRDHIRDYPKPGTMMVDFLAKDFRGNFVVIKHQENEYSFMAHFIPGTFEVNKGDFVKRGQVIGKCGNSGHSTEPHLHFHFQDHPNFYQGKGLPIKFSNVIINGEYKEEGYIKKGERVTPIQQ
ncbi:M23 family metallopeptidase [Alkaliphilus serpentinus]|uniref:M23 family metallopeptidase n=1 Tax=Alkaliphilus serpentinus TaxID=1482731 RepID=A0A833HLI7_9FIRM|nr:M23 family metallopeptidase [Alkaliphilus serpentinus]KAB3525741.1 M23 family metallopeptidase [Alkaliphilus serpentinus]